MSLQLMLLDRMFRLTMKRRLRKNPDVLTLRPMMERMTRVGRSIPRSVRLEATELGGVRAERLETEGADASRAILYLHGGGFVAGSPATHRAITWRLAKGVGVPVHAPDYRLAPEHPFPGGLDDVLTAYKALLSSGIAGDHIVVAGDSAGGNLTLTLALRLKMLGLPRPAALVALSPVTEMIEVFASRHTNARSDAVFDERVFASVNAHYCPNADAANPLISPLRGDVAGLSPTLFQCSDNEMLRDDSLRMAERMTAAGVRVKLEVWPKVFHVWHLAADVLPEARRALDDITAFIKAELSIDRA